MNLGCASVLRCMVDVMHMQKKRTALWAALGYFESSKMCIDDTSYMRGTKAERSKAPSCVDGVPCL